LQQNLPGASFTFWQWLFEIMHLMKEKQLLRIWQSGYVHGFVEKKAVTNMLAHHARKALVFYFSEKVLGAIGIAFIDC
jgi:hypothetical protein